MDLKPNVRYRVIIESEVADDEETTSPWERMRSLIGSIEGPEDWAREHDHYLYGTPKKDSMVT